jgi:hypothetical protein
LLGPGDAKDLQMEIRLSQWRFFLENPLPIHSRALYHTGPKSTVQDYKEITFGVSAGFCLALHSHPHNCINLTIFFFCWTV